MQNCTRLAKESLAVRAATARVQARCETLYTYLANNMESSSTMADRTVPGCPSRHLVPKDQSMTLLMPAWESAEERGGRSMGLTE